ncbi:hypothetical protein WCE14_08915 [Acinetobacter schindleri]|uniref:hypothetical protein n=1 Tax=Acinetobacter schindleri TaxID=108981 RepID=UPI0034D49C85
MLRKPIPILFNSAMVQALLNGEKTQTRRMLKPYQIPVQSAIDKDRPWFSVVQIDPHYGFGCSGATEAECIEELKKMASAGCPYGDVGTRLWVRETWKGATIPSSLEGCDCDDVAVEYVADGAAHYFPGDQIPAEWTMPKAALAGRQVPSIFMPKWASRIELEVTEIGIERVNDISEADAIAEGFDLSKSEAAISQGWYEKPQAAFRRVWSGLYGDPSWTENPWVWVIHFKVVHVLYQK